MTETTFTFRVDDELKAAFAAAAKTQDCTSAQLLRKLMRETVEAASERVEYDKWFIEQVEIGLKEADDPNTEWVSNADIEQNWERQRAELLARAVKHEKRDAAE